MAESKKKEIVLDEDSQAGFDDVQLAFPVRNAAGEQTHYRKASVSRELYNLQMDMDEEDRNPEFRKGAFKQASSLKASDFSQPVAEVAKVETDDERISRLVDERVNAALKKLQTPAANTATQPSTTNPATVPPATPTVK